MTKGRKVVPLPIKLRKGTARPGRINHQEPKVVELREVPPAPEWFEENGAAYVMWHQVARWLVEQKVLGAVDLHNLEAFCQEYETYVTAAKQLRDEGLTVIGSTGSSVKNPIATVKREAAVLMDKFGSLLGLNPAARSRLVSGALFSPTENPFDEF